MQKSNQKPKLRTSSCYKDGFINVFYSLTKYSFIHKIMCSTRFLWESSVSRSLHDIIYTKHIALHTLTCFLLLLKLCEFDGNKWCEKHDTNILTLQCNKTKFPYILQNKLKFSCHLFKNICIWENCNFQIGSYIHKF